MKLLRLHTTNPYRNLAVEEYLFTHAEEEIFMLWQNEPTVVIGKNQNAFAELNLDYIRQNGIHIARRITGGGAVYHDMGNINFSVISPQAGQGGLDFAAFCAPIVAALQKLGVKAELSGRNDLLVDGKKFSGNAQHAHAGRVLHHGTLLFDCDMTVLSSALRPDEEKLRTKAIRSVSSRVTNLKPYLSDFANCDALMRSLLDSVGKAYDATWMVEPQAKEIDDLAARNASEEWIFPPRALVSRYSLVRKQRYTFGTVELAMELDGELLCELHIGGDFFGNAPVSELEELLCRTTRATAREKLSKLCVADYIFGMSAEELLLQIFG